MGWISAAGSVAGGLLSGGGAAYSSAMSARASRRAYQNRYQWSMEDARKAGLNPMLVATQGQPPQAHLPDFENIGSAAVEGARGAFSAIQQKRMNDAQIKNLKADTVAKLSTASAAQAQAGKTQWESSLLATYGSARQGAEINQINQNIAESVERIGEIVSRSQLNEQEFLQRNIHNPIINDLDRALADAKRAEIPLKEAIGFLGTALLDVAKAARGGIELAGEEKANLLRDTANMVEDAYSNANKLGLEHRRKLIEWLNSFRRK